LPVVLLVLFDVDGTLLLSHDPLVGRAMSRAAREVFGVDVDDEALTPGETALRQGRELLRTAGLADEAISPGLARWCKRVGHHYVELLAHADASEWRVPDGVQATLAEVSSRAKVALLTGNPEPVARARMERLGLAHFFPAGQGAFGCEAESRVRLIELARERAGSWPAEETVAVGDTEADVGGAHEAGIRVVGVHGDPSALPGADARISALASLPEVLSSLRP
jgi:phosphoglycolate phosphatase-like HAD superfamily hydrolase